MKKIILLLIISVCLLPNCISAKDDEKIEFKKYFDEYNVIGTFVLYDSNNKKFTRYNPERAKKQFIPASTFKIANTLIGLETGVLPDENYVFKWNGESRFLKDWEKDLNVRDAFQASCVPCYQELARNIGEARMFQWVKKLNYGNKDISGGIDQFWLTGNLRISADQEVKFLRKLYKNDLPVSKSNQEKVKKIMLRAENSRYKIYGKTGWQFEDNEKTGKRHSIGWFVGFLEQNENVYFFALNVETDDTQENFVSSRVAITENILKELKLL